MKGGLDFIFHPFSVLTKGSTLHHRDFIDRGAGLLHLGYPDSEEMNDLLD
jgi:hypothetical protein